MAGFPAIHRRFMYMNENAPDSRMKTPKKQKSAA
jgi:hypothetical protein